MIPISRENGSTFRRTASNPRTGLERCALRDRKCPWHRERWHERADRVSEHAAESATRRLPAPAVDDGGTTCIDITPSPPAIGDDSVDVRRKTAAYGTVTWQNRQRGRGEDRPEHEPRLSPPRQRGRPCHCAGDPVVVELINYRRDGTPFWNQIYLAPVGVTAAAPYSWSSPPSPELSRKRSGHLMSGFSS